MPTYEYACQTCGNLLEVYQRFNDEPLTVCPVCGGPLRKVFHPAGILFKGSGFYATDSRTARDGAKKDRKEKEPAAAKDSSTTSKTDSGGSASSSSDKSSSSGSKSDSKVGSKEKSA
jgi:putative FmdB family regulatory protein